MDRKDGFPWFFGVIPWFPMVFPWVIWAIHHFGLLSRAPPPGCHAQLPSVPTAARENAKGQEGCLGAG